MNPATTAQQRVLSGMRPTGALHLGHYHGVLKNWLKLQHEYECFFFVADWHALTTHYEAPQVIGESVWEMVIDWLAAGINPGSAHVFIQSRVPEHAELHLLLSMVTPLGWLERVPTYKDQQEQLRDRDLATYGFLGYPLLQSADILVYKAGLVPVGEDQVPHVELTREVARRFNYLYGREPDFAEKAEAAAGKMGKKNAKLYRELRRRYQEAGEQEALATARALLEDQQNITLGDRERLFGYLEGSSKIILPEPAAAAHPGLEDAGPGRAQDVQVLQQRHRPARGAGRGGAEAAHHADRPGAGAAHRSRRAREVPGLGAAQGILRRGDAGLGRGGLPQRRHRLPGLQAAGHRRRTG